MKKKHAPKQITLNITLTKELRQTLDTMSKQKGIGPSTLARMLMLEGLGKQKG